MKRDDEELDGWIEQQYESVWVAAIVLSLVIGAILGGAAGILCHSWRVFFTVDVMTFLASMHLTLRGING